MPARPARCVLVAAALALSAAALAPASAAASQHGDGKDHDPGSLTYAVYGDAPYGSSPTDTSETDATPGFIRAVNADKAVSAVLHVGDIHSGSQYCTQAYDQQVADLWAGFADPMIYTPGDNEWSDCHKKKEGGGSYNAATGQIDYVKDAEGNLVNYAGGNPVDNLAMVRSIFFARPGGTLGSGRLKVLSQAQVDNHAHPTDGQYVENVMWERDGVLFATLNVPGGSNNDADPWYAAPTATPQQTTEAANRTGAALRWLDRAFTTAIKTHARSVVVMTQADMWDLDGKEVSHLTNYEPIVNSLATHTQAIGKPVLLLNGDSHVYRSDNPLQKASPCTGDEDVCSYDDWISHPSYDVSNFHRTVVHGSTIPLEYLRLRVNSKNQPSTATSFGPFSWQRVTQ
ncbi:MAG: metallophosphoesterase [Marmoricola sp.]